MAALFLLTLGVFCVSIKKNEATSFRGEDGDYFGRF